MLYSVAICDILLYECTIELFKVVREAVICLALCVNVVEYVDFVILRKGWGLILNDDNKSDSVGVVKVCASNHFVKIKNGETVKIRVCFLKNELPYNFMSAFACLLYQSFDKEYWKQLLLIPECKTESSFHIDYIYYCTHFR